MGYGKLAQLSSPGVYAVKKKLVDCQEMVHVEFLTIVNWKSLQALMMKHRLSIRSKACCDLTPAEFPNRPLKGSRGGSMARFFFFSLREPRKGIDRHIQAFPYIAGRFLAF
ncbi:hypothetical protein EM20IM_06055 [Candidatus Methylacidiphilum infernorum]|uniref:Transposase n=1 Tax=Candidatus Methylacidiphilum infernorum TaxID=511746 RepID=A0ABX7PSW2_9BACT|nr:hypothetical protein [Candidatus Methylacidiphilum infernorum]QSR86075.1 hypothetical protein EM20IM_06055 [Candidatus Methylacidiphilum infernorum]